MAVKYVEVTVRVFKNNYVEQTEITKKPLAGVVAADDLTELLTEIEDLVTEDL